MFQVSIAQVAQSVEQGTENPRVGGSIPPLGTFLREPPEISDSEDCFSEASSSHDSYRV